MRLDKIRPEWLPELYQFQERHAPTLAARAVESQERQPVYAWELGCRGCEYAYPQLIRQIRDALYEHRRHVTREIDRAYREWRSARKEANAAERE